MPVAEQSLGGEQGHLRVIGDSPGAAVGGHVPGDARWPVPLADLVKGEELDARAESVADSAAEQAAPVAIAQRDHRAPSAV